MKHFIVEIIYKAPLEVIESVRPVHRKFLQTGYETGRLLVSGPKASGKGGMVVAKDESQEQIALFFENDPYFLQGLAEYKFIEFTPVSHQDILKDWLS